MEMEEMDENMDKEEASRSPLFKPAVLYLDRPFDMEETGEFIGFG